MDPKTPKPHFIKFDYKIIYFKYEIKLKI